MKFGVLGTGMAGQAIASKLVEQGHEVCMGAREKDNPKAEAWAAATGDAARHGAFVDAARHGDIVFNCTKGEASLEALKAAGADHLKDKILVDVSNPLDYSKGMPPTLLMCNSDSLGEQIQAAFPQTRVVKTLNTVTAPLMVAPHELAGGDHEMFLCGNDAAAKAEVSRLLRSFGWSRIVDLGDITNARGTEAYLLLWVRLYGALGSPQFNVRVVR